MHNKKRILLVEDHALFRAGIVAILRQSDEFMLAGEAQTGEEAIEMSLDLFPEIVIMDIGLPELDGIECTRRLLSLFPRIRILALTWHEEEQVIVDMISAGAKGYLNKNAGAGELLTALRAISTGNHYYSPLASSVLIARATDKAAPILQHTEADRSLTAREQEIMRLIFEEFTNQEIARSLFISTKTVETHKRNILQKLKVKGTVGLVKYYLKHLSRNELINGMR